MKVLIVHDYGTLSGGAEHMSLSLRDGLRRLGHDAQWLASTARPLPLPIHADRTCFGTTTSLSRVTKVYNHAAVRGVRRAIRDFEPDVVHLRMFMTQLSPAILPILTGIPTVHHVVNYDLVCPLNLKHLPDGTSCEAPPGRRCRSEGCLPWAGVARAQAQRWLTRRHFGALDRVVCNSEWVRRRLEREDWPVDAVIWNGVPERPAREKRSETPTLSYAGRLVAKKGVDVLIRALAELSEEIPATRLIVAGDGPSRAALEHLAVELGVRSNVDFMGHVPRPELEARLSQSWVHVVPSIWEEPFGLVAAEALMRGVPVVVSNAGGLAEIVHDGRTGLHFRTGDAQDLRACLMRVLSDPALARSLAASGHAWARRELAEATMVRRFEGLYANLLERQSPRLPVPGPEPTRG